MKRPQRNQHLKHVNTERPTTLDIIWAAGVYEGEGTVQPKNGSTVVQVPQVDRWLLDRLKALFGGEIHAAKSNKKCAEWHVWSICGARARGFVMTIYKFLSPRRKEQIRKALL